MKNRRIDLLIGILIIALAAGYGLYKRIQIDKHGVITVAKIEKFEAAEQGGNLSITIFFNGRSYKTVVDAICISCKQKFYFIKVHPTNPTSDPIFYEDKPVPPCILNAPLPKQGWKEIPADTCK